MKENNKEIREEVPISNERADETPQAKTVETPEVETTEAPGAEITDTPAVTEKKQTTRRKKRAAPEEAAATADEDTPKKEASGEVKKEAPAPRLKASLRQGFQLKGRYYSSTELRRKTVLEKLYKQYPGLFEK